MLRWLIKNLRTFLLAFALALAVWISAVTAANPDETQAYPKSIPIEFKGQDPGLVISGNVPKQVNITLRAPRSEWQQLTNQENIIRAIVDLSGLDIGNHKVRVQVQIGIRPVQLVSVSPNEFDLTLEKLSTHSLPIELDLIGEPAIGYQAGDAAVSPETVIVSGPESTVGHVFRVRALLDISGMRQNLDVSLPLEALDENGQTLPNLTLNPDKALVSLSVIQLGGYRDLAVKVVTQGRIASGYRLTNITSSPPVVTVYSTNTDLITALPGYVSTAPLDLSGARSDIETYLTLNLPSGVTLIGEQSVLVQIGIEAIEGSLTFSNRPVEVIGLSHNLQAQISPLRVDVILSGPLPVLDTLSSIDLRVVVDATGLSAGSYQLSPTVVILIEDVQVESILPETIEVILSTALTPSP